MPKYIDADKLCAKMKAYFGVRNGEIPSADAVAILSAIDEAEPLYRKKKDATEVETPYPYNLLEEIFGETYEAILDDDQIKGLEHVLGTLTEREQEILKERYKNDLTWEEAGKLHHVTRERIRQICAKAIRKMRHPTRWKCITLGYKAMSGELRKQVEERYRTQIEALEAEYTEKAAELQKKIASIGNPNASREELQGFIASLDTPIENLDFSVRTYNCLARAGKRTLGEICNMTDDELKNVRNLGRKSYEEVICKLAECGLKLTEE